MSTYLVFGEELFPLKLAQGVCLARPHSQGVLAISLEAYVFRFFTKRIVLCSELLLQRSLLHGA